VTASPWLRQQFTLPNIALVCAMSVSVGGYVKGFGALESKVAAQDEKIERLAADVAARLSKEQEANAITFSRRDVLEALLVSINSRLSNIEGDVRDLKMRPRQER
jgi:hypothetical protein